MYLKRWRTLRINAGLGQTKIAEILGILEEIGDKRE